MGDAGDITAGFFIGEHLPAPGRAVSKDVLDKAAAENVGTI